MANTLLLTGTIDPNVFNTNKDDKPINVYLTDARERLNQYNAAIERYIKESSFDSIVFAENSGAKFDLEHVLWNGTRSRQPMHRTPYRLY